MRRADGRTARGVVLLLGLVGCGPASGSGPHGRIEVSWRGADSGAMSAPATALWCPGERFVEITGTRGDTGIGIALHPTDSVVPGVYPVARPDSTPPPPPWSAVGLRLLARTSVAGYQGDSGTVTVEPAPAGRLAARFAVVAQAVGVTGRVTVRGRLDGVPVHRGGAECTPPP
ncbi:MAG TPA: hypothetical protein VFU46_08800 [Gemmatimonadales bacterium]|nr:hypothetical protein [Gemmatimonadales bacterium]